MNWEALGAIGQIVGVVVVIITLVYLAIQVRQNSTALRLSASSSYQATYSAVELAISTTPGLAEILLKSQKEQDLTEAEKLTILLLFRTILRGWQNTYLQYLTGALEEEVWIGERNQMQKTLAFDAGLVSFWRQNQDLYTRGFNEVIRLIIKNS
jgi:hypothetical protein